MGVLTLMVKEIQLTKGQVAIVDDQLYEELSSKKWVAWRSKSGKFYAVRTDYSPKRTTRMATCVIGQCYGKMVDHINGDTLDNRACNLRHVTSRQNSQNRHVPSTSKYPGVNYDSKTPRLKTKKWLCRIQINGKTKNLGRYKTEEEAATVYRVAEAVLVDGK